MDRLKCPKYLIEKEKASEEALKHFSSIVRSIQIGGIEQANDITFDIVFSVEQQITENELAYYVSNNALPVIQKDYGFAELVNPVYTMNDESVNVVVSVKYLDQETKTTHLS